MPVGAQGPDHPVAVDHQLRPLEAGGARHEEEDGEPDADQNRQLDAHEDRREGRHQHQAGVVTRGAQRIGQPPPVEQPIGGHQEQRGQRALRMKRASGAKNRTTSATVTAVMIPENRLTAPAW